ncbi:MAG: recombinase zinc beta ribbon domain-containing protein [Christensenellales bacterium]|jgi:site-specific DNA recombinase
MFSGFLICADCGHALHFHFNQGNPDITYFNCSNYNRARGTCNATHYIRTDFLEQVVLAEIRRLTKFVARHEKEFAEAMMAYSAKKVISDLNLKHKELNSYLHRDKELDVIFEKLYEDNVSGKISDEHFAKMGRSYEDEQAKLSEKSSIFEQRWARQNSSKYL